MNTATRLERRKHLLTTPRAAAAAGIISGVLFTVTLLIMRLNTPEATTETGAYLTEKAGLFSLVLHLMTFAGIFFLWFMGVARDRLGSLEDRFFSTLFLGSGLLYLGISYTAAAIGGGILLSFPLLEPAFGEAVFKFAQSVLALLEQVYAIRMAAVFMISAATMWQRTAVMPRWLVLFTYLLALGLLALVNFSLWITLVFPIWMIVVSTMILIFNYRRSSEGQLEPTPGV